MATKQELAREEDSAWAEFDGLVESLAPSQIEQPGYSERWSVKDVGSCLAEAGLVLQQIRMETYRDEELDVDAMNRDFCEVNRDLPLSVVRAEYCSARNRMLQEWEALRDVTPDAEEWFRESGPRHYAEHVERLREWVGEFRSRG